MAIICQFVLCGVALLMLVVMVEAVVSVTKRPSWSPALASSLFTLVTTAERRTNPLSFVGADRRKVGVGHAGRSKLPGRI